MTRADYFMEDMIYRIQKEGFKDINPRPKYADGTPAHTISVNHTFRQYDLSKEFPICTLRPQAWKTGIKEIFTIYQKPTNVIEEMCERGVTWWGEWDIGDGTIGQRYGTTVKRYDLVNKLINDIKNDPYGRRKIISLWQETDLAETPGLAPCAFQTIWNVRGEYLDMLLVQRSGDMLTASGPGGINEIQYAAFLMMIARHTGISQVSLVMLLLMNKFTTDIWMPQIKCYLVLVQERLKNLLVILIMIVDTRKLQC